MSQSRSDKPLPHLNASAKRKLLKLSNEAVIKAEPLYNNHNFPLVIRPALPDMCLAAWARDSKDFIESKLLEHGGILFRGFNVRTASEFEKFVVTACGQPLEYHERSSPRTRVSGKIYSSTNYPADHNIFLHNENSYQNSWPLKIFFFCETPAEQGGETPIADCRRVLDHISPEIRDRFIDKKWMYVRNFGSGFGLDWPTVFQTSDKQAVEDHCRRNGIEFEWRKDGRLRTRAVRRALFKHPRSGELTWFNHATFFHVTTLDPGVRTVLQRQFDEQDLPTNTYYGDGSPIEDSVLDELRNAYLKEAVVFSWERGDVLMLDNMLAAHGRNPYKGYRRVLVGMAEAMRCDQMEAR